MKKIVAEVIRLSDSSLYPRVYCIDGHGIIDEEVTMTLCDVVWELHGQPLFELEQLIEDAQLQKYIPGNPDLADMSSNDKLIFVRPPFVNPGQICISNENIPEFSIDEGMAQRFSLAQFRIAAKAAQNFAGQISMYGLQTLAAHKFEIDFPEANS